MRYDVVIGENTHAVEISQGRDGLLRVKVGDGAEQILDARSVGRAEWLVREVAGEGGRTRRVALAVQGGRYAAQIGGHAVLGEIRDPRRARLDMGGGAGEGTVISQMPGAVVRVLVKAGDAVHKGQSLVVVEAMKMENEFKATIDGVVESVAVVPGQAIEAGTVLAVVQPAEA